MRKNLLLPIFLAFFLSFGFGNAYSQTPCTPDLQYNAPGIFPSDTLPDLTVGVQYNEVVHFIFPPDTNLGGFVLEFDSFVVSSVSNVPAGVTWDCDQTANNCVYLTTSGQLTRGCVAIDGMATGTTANFPQYDSIIVVGDGWVTVPFVGAQKATDNIPVYFRVVAGGTSVESELVQNLNLAVAPNPASVTASITYNISEVADVEVSIVNVMGQHVRTLRNEKGEYGGYRIDFEVDDLPAGIYYVRVDLNNGEYVKSKKFTAIH